MKLLEKVKRRVAVRDYYDLGSFSHLEVFKNEDESAHP